MMAVCASTATIEVARRGQRAERARRVPLAVALGLVLLGLIALVARLDTPSDGTVVRPGWSSWRVDGVIVDVPGPGEGSAVRTGDLITDIAGHHLADGLGGVAWPRPGEDVSYEVSRNAPTRLTVRVERAAPYPLLVAGWGNLVFVFALAGLALALYVRRPDEPATTPLLLLAAGLLGSTLTVVAGLPALALATGGPVLWLFHLSVIGVYSIAWGGLLAFSLLFPRSHPWLRRRRTLVLAYAAPLAAMGVWTAGTAAFGPDALRRLGLVHTGQTAVVAATLVTSAIMGIVAYRRNRDPLTRRRLWWLAGGGMAAGLLGIAGWLLPELVSGRQLLPAGAIGLSGLPFVAGIGVALRRHRLFDIERLANRSLVYAAVAAVLAGGYAAMVALLVSGLRLSGPVAAAIAAAAAALTLAPLRSAAQGAVNRLMYGDRDDPAGALARLGDRLQGVMLPGDVLPAVVETVAQSLRLPYAAIDLAAGDDGFRPAAEHGVPVGAVYAEPLTHHGVTVGRLRVSDRVRDDPLEPADLGLIRSLARQVGPAVQAVRLHEDLLRSRAEVVALREDERRRLRRDLHDGLGPALAAIGLKAGLAAREIPPEAPARAMLSEITAEVKASLMDVRRLVEALRPPALDELGLVGAVRSRAATLTGELEIEVRGPVPSGQLPAAIETAAYRIAVEAMTNAVRHSGGTRCIVSVAAADGGIELTVRDDGRGLDPARTAGVGLRSMQERAAEVGGQLSVRSATAGGTVVHASLPLGLGGPRDQADTR